MMNSPFDRVPHPTITGVGTSKNGTHYHYGHWGDLFFGAYLFSDDRKALDVSMTEVDSIDAFPSVSHPNGVRLNVTRVGAPKTEVTASLTNAQARKLRDQLNDLNLT